MLGKTAGGLFWMFRYLERAENTARLIDAGFRIAMTRSDVEESEWRSIIETSSARRQFEALHESYRGPVVIDFLLREAEYPSSILAAFGAARRNARLVRTALTREVWEAVNDGWIELARILNKPVPDTELPSVLALVRKQSSLVRGAQYGTMMRDDVFAFCRLGTLLERFDSTVRLLDVKYFILLPSVSMIGSSLDNVQWQTILRAASGERAFGWLHGDDAGPMPVAEFLIKDERMPRSLAFSSKGLVQYLRQLAQIYGEEAASHGLARQLEQAICDSTIDEIFDIGLHEFLQTVSGRGRALSEAMQTDYRFTG